MPEKKVKKTARPAARNAAKKAAAPPPNTTRASAPASDRITALIRELGEWRGEKLALVRKLIHEADPTIVEEWKWDGPVWSRDGIICTGETYKQTVKLTFARGASLPDPGHLFNAGLAGNVRRAIDLRAHDELDGPSFRELIREAVAFNRDRSGGGPAPSRLT